MRRLGVALVVLVALGAALALPGTGAAAGTASISGTVTDFASGQGLTAYVDVYDNGYYAGSTTTNADGTYTISGLAAGSYIIEFDEGDHLPQFWNDKLTYQTADTLALSDGQARAGINAALHTYGSITGTISDGGGVVNGATALATDSNGNTYYGYSDTSGNYTIANLAPGQYTVEFVPGYSDSGDAPQYYNGKTSAASANPVSVSEDTTTSSINANLPAQAIIAGTVSDASYPSGVCNVVATLYRSDGSVQNTSGVDCGGSDNGQYSFEQLPAGTYKVGFVPQHYGPGNQADGDLPTYDGGSTLAAAASITVAAGDTSNGNNATLPTGASITGTVTSDNGEVPGGASVSVLDSGGNTVRSVTPDSSGHYLLEGLATGSYAVSFTAGDYTTVFYPNATTQTQGQTISLTAPQVRTGVNQTIQLADGVTGVITGSGGAPLAGAFVQLQDANGNTLGSDTTDASGRYNLPDGAATVYVSVHDDDGGYEPGFYGGSGVDSATAITLSSSAPLATANVTLAAAPTGGTITGTVSGPNGPAANIHVTAYNAAGTPAAQATTATDGTYSIDSLAQGSYRLGFVDPGGALAAQFYDDEATLADADPVYVGAPGAVVRGIDALLGASDSSGTPGSVTTISTTSPSPPPPTSPLTSGSAPAVNPTLGGLLAGLHLQKFHNAKVPLIVAGFGYNRRTTVLTVTVVCGRSTPCPITFSASRGRRAVLSGHRSVTAGRHAVTLGRVRGRATLIAVVHDADGTVAQATLHVPARARR